MTKHPSALDIPGYADMLDAIGETFTPKELAEISRLSEALRRKVEGNSELGSDLAATPRCALERPAGRCEMGVGCDEVGVCYAAAQGRADMCMHTSSETEKDL